MDFRLTIFFFFSFTLITDVPERLTLNSKTMLTWTCMLIFTYAVGDEDFNVNLEPGLPKQDYESIEEVKAHAETSTEKEPEDTEWIPEAVLDVAYYLRRHKFNGYDRRYQITEDDAVRNLFIQFPKPPLRNVHWEVKKFCEPSFIDCLKYLQEQIQKTELPRHLDTLALIKQNSWSVDKDIEAIKTADAECLKLREKDENTYEVFPGPLQKFQWLTSASYYMCWYTMLGKSFLEHFNDRCDNYANCIDWDYGPYNGDVRAVDEVPFACAMYSFCPDPCCPLKYLNNTEECFKRNPCYGHRPKNETCWVARNENENFEPMVFNKWNVTCHCDEEGMKWESKSGLCVDIDECAESPNPCHLPSESCINLPGSFECMCNMMGYRYNPETQTCTKDLIIHSILYPHHYESLKSGKLSFSNAMHTLVDKWKSFLSISAVNNELEENRTDAKSTNLFTEPKN